MRKDLFQASAPDVGTNCGQSNDHFSRCSGGESRIKSGSESRGEGNEPKTPSHL